MAAADKIDSNVTGLSIAQEASSGTLPGTPIWIALQPNSYGSFGASLTTTPRNPISQLRQARKGVTTDLDATGAFEQDLSMYTFSELWPGLMLANKNKAPQFGGRNTTTPVDSVTTDTLDFGTDAATLGFVVGMLIHTEGFGVAANNTGANVRQISAVSGDTVTATGYAAEATPPQDAIVRVVGFQGTAGDIDVTRPASDFPRLVSTTADFTDFGLSIGDWVRIGGPASAATTRFSNAGNTTLARIGQTVTANEMIFDLTTGGTNGSTEMTAETGTGDTIQIFFGDISTNVAANDANFNQITYTLERSLGEADDANGEIQAETIAGALLNEAAISIPTANKIAVNTTFLATASTNFSGASGDERPTNGETVRELQNSDVFNTVDNVPDIRLFLRSTDPAAIVPSGFFAFISELTMTVSNNATANKAVGTLGAFAVTAGNFTCNSAMTGYFQNVSALNAIRNNSDVGLFAFTKQTLGSRQAGILFDLPFGSVSTSGLNVAGDQPITAPLTLASAVDPDSNRTMTITEFFYLPE